MLQRRLGPHRRPGLPLLPPLSFTPALSRSRPNHPPTHPCTHERERGETPGCKLLPEPCQVGAQVLDTCVYTSGLHACMRGIEGGRGRGKGGKRARMFLDSIAPRYYVSGQREREGRGAGGGKIHYLSHSGARALSGAI